MTDSNNTSDEENNPRFSEFGRIISTNHTSTWEPTLDSTNAVPTNHWDFGTLDFDNLSTFSKPKKECRLKKYRREQAEKKKKKWYKRVKKW